MNRQVSQVSRILAPATIMRVNKCPTVNYWGLEILNRWAVNQPDDLKELERNTAYLMIRLLEQQTLEKEILDRPESLTQLTQGLTRHEILTNHEVDMDL